jgi:hypothetical protein
MLSYLRIYKIIPNIHVTQRAAKMRIASLENIPHGIPQKECQIEGPLQMTAVYCAVLAQLELQYMCSKQ